MIDHLGPYLLGPNNENQGIYDGDVRDLLPLVPSESIDVVVTSPPYNLGSRYANQGGGAIQGKWSKVIQYDDYQDNLPEDEYRDWQQDVISELWRVIKPTGAIFYNHRPRIQKGSVWHRLDLLPGNVTLRQIIVWKRPKGHNFNRGYFVPSYEWIFLSAKEHFELGPGQSGISDVWEFSPKRGSDHPAPFPIDLPLRAIQASGHCEIVLDPFIGEGTTAEAAIMLGKQILGFELIPRWAEKARTQIHSAGRSLLAPKDTQLAQQRMF